jgi:FERM, RhoGEF and pleckstrin domain protein 2
MSLNSLGTSNGMTSSRMTHSLSTPSGVDGGSSAASRSGGKKLAIRVQMLDDSMTLFQVQACDIICTNVFKY